MKDDEIWLYSNKSQSLKKLGDCNKCSIRKECYHTLCTANKSICLLLEKIINDGRQHE